MEKPLSSMSLEELWTLFPIIVSEYNPQYKSWYEIEQASILSIIKNEGIIRINHIGSSAVEGLLSKPTVDILMEIDGCCNVTELIGTLETADWTLMQQKSDPVRFSFCKGYTSAGLAEKSYHLHVVYHGNWDELYFRDLLITHPDIANKYGNLKLRLSKDFANDRDGYTRAKSSFIKQYSSFAKQLFSNIHKPMQ